MEGYSVGIALLLALYGYFAILAHLGPAWQFADPIVAGLFTGLIVGDVPLGLAIGGTLELMSLGLWTYGGATIPDYMTGAIVGTAVAALSNEPLSVAITQGIAVAVPVSLLMTQLDILGRSITTVFIHGADHYAETHNERGIVLMHWLGQLPWGLSRAIPLFFAIWLGAGPIQNLVSAIPAWLTNGFTAMGHLLPALGFGILLTYLPLPKYWGFFVLGFVLFAYLKMPLIGIMLAVLAVVAIYNYLSSRIERVESVQAEEMGEEVPKGYITAKQEKAEAARKLGFSVYSRFKSKERPKGKALSMTVDPECDCFLCAAKLEEKKAKEMLSFLQLLSNFTDIRN